MFFSKPVKSLPSVRLYQQNVCIYDGFLKDLPIREDVLLSKSVEFFDDPEPCEIHRSAVASRLFYELENTLSQTPSADTCPLLLSYIDIPEFDRYEFSAGH